MKTLRSLQQIMREDKLSLHKATPIYYQERNAYIDSLQKKPQPGDDAPVKGGVLDAWKQTEHSHPWPFAEEPKRWEGETDEQYNRRTGKGLFLPYPGINPAQPWTQQPLTAPKRTLEEAKEDWRKGMEEAINKVKAAKKEAADAIKPPYYNDTAITPFQVIDAWGLSFRLGNVVKYLCRNGKKGDALPDLRKAAEYLASEISRLESPAN